MRKLLYITLLLMTYACKKSENKPELPVNPGAGDPEVMTTLILKAKNIADPNDTTIVRFRDLTGSNWSLDSLILNDSSMYDISITVLNESALPVVYNITDEIEQEKDYHQFYYQTVPGSHITFTYLNFDNYGKPFGTKMKFQTQQAGTGALNVSLKHYSALTQKDGNIFSGATDIYVEFPLLIKN